MTRMALVLFCCLATASTAGAAERIKIGFITTLTGPAAVLGKDMANGATLALKLLGGKMGGVPTQIILEDDRMSPRTGVQKAQKLIDKDKVDFLAGLIFGHVTAAVWGVAKRSGIMTVATVGSIPPILGKGCSKNYFTVSWILDSNYEAVGSYLNGKGVKSAFLMVPNYVAGKLVTSGFRRTFKGKILGEIRTKLNQLDYSVELAQVRSKAPEALVVFYPGGMGINFLKQYKLSGMMTKIPVYSAVFIADESTFPALGDIPLGLVTTSNWNPELANAANKRFVAAYRAAHGKRPTSMAAMGYDTIMLIAGAVKDVNGKIEDKGKLRAALRKASFQSVRGPFKFNNNHFPIQNYYLNKVAKDASGKLYNKLVGVVLRNQKDFFYTKCSMRW